MFVSLTPVFLWESMHNRLRLPSHLVRASLVAAFTGARAHLLLSCGRFCTYLGCPRNTDDEPFAERVAGQLDQLGHFLEAYESRQNRRIGLDLLHFPPARMFDDPAWIDFIANKEGEKETPDSAEQFHWLHHPAFDLSLLGKAETWERWYEPQRNRIGYTNLE